MHVLVCMYVHTLHTDFKAQAKIIYTTNSRLTTLCMYCTVHTYGYISINNEVPLFPFLDRIEKKSRECARYVYMIMYVCTEKEKRRGEKEKKQKNFEKKGGGGGKRNIAP